MDFEEIRHEIQFWMDFTQSGFDEMSPDKIGSVVYKIYSMMGYQKKDMGEDFFKTLELLLPNIQNELIKYFNQILNLQKNPNAWFELPSIRRAVATANEIITAVPSDFGEGGGLIPFFVVLKIFDLMAGQSINIVKRCVVCRKFFCYPPKENKIYCSAACRWRASKQRYRKRKAVNQRLDNI